MMLFDPALAAEPLLDVVRGARVELRVQAESIPPLLRPALRDARGRDVRIRYLLGPKASYTLDAQGRPLLPSRPYAHGQQAEELAFASTTGELSINPQFSELGPAGEFRAGLRSHAFYVASAKAAVLCTGVPRGRTRVLCLSGDEALARALTALFDSEFEDALQAALRDTLAERAREQVVVGPNDNEPLLALLQLPGAMVLTSELDQGRALQRLARGPAKTLLLPEAVAGLPAAEAARRAGIEVRARRGAFDGTVVWTPGRAFIGSQRLTDAALQRDRDVGVLLQGEGAAAVHRFLLDTR